MRFTLTKRHQDIHREFREKHRYHNITRWLDRQHPELFVKMINEERVDWTILAVLKAKEFHFDEHQLYIQEFCRVVARIGLEFETDPRCEAITGILKNDIKYTGFPLEAVEQLQLLNNFLDASGAQAIGTRLDAGQNCVLPKNNTSTNNKKDV